MSGIHNINNMYRTILFARLCSRRHKKDKDEENENEKEIMDLLETTPGWKIFAICAGTILVYVGTAVLAAFLLFKFFGIC